jgi:hypothetical protein
MLQWSHTFIFLGSGLNCIAEMAGQMAKKCEEVFEERAEARSKTLTKQFAAICLSRMDRVLFTGCIVAKA